MVKPAEPKEVILEILAIQGRGLPNKDFFKKQDPFLQFEIGHLSQRTKVDKNGGMRPEWNHRIRFERLRCPIEKELKITCFDSEWKRKEQFIGECTLDLAPILKTGEEDGWFKLNDRGADAGEVYLELTFYTHDGLEKLSKYYIAPLPLESASSASPPKVLTGPIPMPPPASSSAANFLNSPIKLTNKISQGPSGGTTKIGQSLPRPPIPISPTSDTEANHNASSLPSNPQTSQSATSGSKPLPVIGQLNSTSRPDTSHTLSPEKDTDPVVLQPQPAPEIAAVVAPPPEAPAPSPPAPPVVSYSSTTPKEDPASKFAEVMAPSATSPANSQKETIKPFTISSFVPTPVPSSSKPKPVEITPKPSASKPEETLNSITSTSQPSKHAHVEPATPIVPKEDTNESFSTQAATPTLTTDAHGYVPASNSASSKHQEPVSPEQRPASNSGGDKLDIQNSFTPGHSNHSSISSNILEQPFYSDSPPASSIKQSTTSSYFNTHGTSTVPAAATNPGSNLNTELNNFMDNLEAKEAGYQPSPEAAYPSLTFKASSPLATSPPVKVYSNGVTHSNSISSTANVPSTTETSSTKILDNPLSNPIRPTVSSSSKVNPQEALGAVLTGTAAALLPATHSVPDNISTNQSSPNTFESSQSVTSSNLQSTPIVSQLPISAPIPQASLASQHSTTAPAAHTHAVSQPFTSAPVTNDASLAPQHSTTVPVTHVQVASQRPTSAPVTPVPVVTPSNQTDTVSSSSNQPPLPPRPAVPATLVTVAGGGFVYQFLPPQGGPSNSGPSPPHQTSFPSISSPSSTHGNNPHNFSGPPSGNMPPAFPIPSSGNPNNFPTPPSGNNSPFHFSPPPNPANNAFPAFPNFQNYMPNPTIPYGGAPFNPHIPPQMPNFPSHNTWGHSGPSPGSNQMPTFHQPPPLPSKPSHMPSNYGQNVPPPLPSRPSTSPSNQHGFPQRPPLGMPNVPMHYNNVNPGSSNGGPNGNPMPGHGHSHSHSHSYNYASVQNPNNFRPSTSSSQPPSSANGKKKKKNKLGFLF